MYNKRQLLAGILSGLIVPVILILLIYAVKFKESSFNSFVMASIEQNVAAPIIALSLIGNLGLFFLFLQRNMFWASRGVMVSTLLYGFLMLYLKLFA